MTSRSIGALGAGQCLNWGVLYYAFAVLLPPVQAELGRPPWVVAGAFSLALLLSAALAPAVGRWCDRGHAARLMTVGAPAAALALLVWSVLPGVAGIAGLYGVWAVLGLCMALTLYEPAFALITRAHDDAAARLRALAIVTVFGGMASTVVLPLTALLVDRAGWRAAAASLAALLLVSTVLTAWAARGEDPRPATRAATAGPARRDPVEAGDLARRTRPLQIVFGLASLASSAFIANLVPALVERAVAPTTAGLLGGLFGVMQLPGRLLVAGRHVSPSASAVVATSFALQAAGLIVVAATTGTAVLAGGVVLFAAGAGLTIVARPYVVQALFPLEHAGAANGRLAQSQQVMRAVGPVLVAWLAGATSHAWIFGLLGLLLGAVAVTVVRRLGAPTSGRGSPG